MELFEVGSEGLKLPSMSLHFIAVQVARPGISAVLDEGALRHQAGNLLIQPIALRSESLSFVFLLKGHATPRRERSDCHY